MRAMPAPILRSKWRRTRGSIAEVGFVNPVLAGDDGVMVAGHGRVLAARKLGLAEVPVIVVSHLTPTQRRALMIADNLIATNAGWNDEMLTAELAALRDEDVDLGLLGFDEPSRRVLPKQRCKRAPAKTVQREFWFREALSHCR
jgi:ParB-like chromosome segregation protein Spo0J